MASGASPAQPAQQETTESETSRQETTELETSRQDTTESETSRQEITESETSRQETTESETSRQETTESETSPLCECPMEDTRTKPTKSGLAEFEALVAASGVTDVIKLEEMMWQMALDVDIPDDWYPLPRDPNYANIYTRPYKYRGMVFLNSHVFFDCPGFWARYRGRPSDVFVASFPKSGTTWLQEIVWRVVHRQTGPESGDGKTLEYRFPLLDIPPLMNMEMLPLHDMSSPRLIKTHLMHHVLPESVHTSGAKVIYISRDARDVCVSYYHFQRMVAYESYRGTFAEFRDKFVRGEVLYSPYREHVKGYLDHADTVLCVTYEQLHRDRAAVVNRVAKFLGKPLTDEEAKSVVKYTDFENMKNNPACNFNHWREAGIVKTDEEGIFMRKGKMGDWRNYFTEEESEEFMKWRNTPI